MLRSCFVRVARLSLGAALFGVLTAPALAQSPQVSAPFSGAKVNGGTVTLTRTGDAITLKLSSDFEVPDTPDPHWQVVDSRGTVFLLQRLGIKGDKVNRSITLPAYVRDVARVEIYCSWAEAVLGSAAFGGPRATN